LRRAFDVVLGDRADNDGTAGNLAAARRHAAACSDTARAYAFF